MVNNGHLHNEIDLAGSEGFEWHESRYTTPQLDPVVFHAWSRRGRVGFRPTSIFGLRSWQFAKLGVSCDVVLEIDIFASSTSEFNIITVDFIKHFGATVFYED